MPPNNTLQRTRKQPRAAEHARYADLTGIVAYCAPLYLVKY
jgi:hypothetical protein